MSKITFDILSPTSCNDTDAVRDLLATLADLLIGDDSKDEAEYASRRTCDPSDTIKYACCRFLNQIDSSGIPDGYEVSGRDIELLENLAEWDSPVDMPVYKALRWAQAHPEESSPTPTGRSTWKK